MSGGPPGTMVVIVGPSGAGKDTLIDFAANRLRGEPRIHFVRRVITRPTDAGGENHSSVSDEDFDRLARDGAFAVFWHAHGLKYGIPSAVFDLLAKGEAIVANGSRSALSQFQGAFPRLKVVSVTASREVLAARLEQRGRESRQDILKRLERGDLSIGGAFDITQIDNSGPLAEAGDRLVRLIRAAGCPPS